MQGNHPGKENQVRSVPVPKKGVGVVSEERDLSRVEEITPAKSE